MSILGQLWSDILHPRKPVREEVWVCRITGYSKRIAPASLSTKLSGNLSVSFEGSGVNSSYRKMMGEQRVLIFGAGAPIHLMGGLRRSV